jgi:hypothetical protein
LTVSPDPGDHTVRVTAGQGCAWTTRSDDRWITVSSGGSGNGTVTITVERNILPLNRTGTVVVAGRTVTVTQRGFTGQLHLDGALSALLGTCPSITFTLNGQQVRTDSSTRFRPSCAALRSGTSVRVRGRVDATGVLVADRVDRAGDDDDDDDDDDDNGDEDEVQPEGM